MWSFRRIYLHGGDADLHQEQMLLPPDPLASAEGEPEDPREELVLRLIEHEKFKNAAQLLYRSSKLKRTSGRSRTNRSITTKARKANWLFRSWIW